MDKKKMLNLVLAALPLIAVVLAGMPNAVTIYQMTEETAAVSCSFFTLIEDVDAAVCLPYAGIFGGLTFGLAVVWLVNQKRGLLLLIAAAAFLSMTLAVVPVLVGGDVMMVPNMLVPILMGVECLMAYSFHKKPMEDDKKAKGKRLN